MNFIDLFAGAGGLSEGFVRAGFNPIAHVEADVYACETLKTRAAFHYLSTQNEESEYYKYISGTISRDQFFSRIPENLLDAIINEEISDKSINNIFDKIEYLMSKNNTNDIDLVIGGPPCQAYSLVGRARNAKKSIEEKQHDPRNYLYKLYVMFLKKYKPKMFVFENVPGLLSAGNKTYFNDLIKCIEDAGYIMEYKILDSSLYGVLQKRKRVIIIGWQQGMDLTYPIFKEIKHNFLVDSILYDLPELIPGETINEYKKPPNDFLRLTKIRNMNDILTQNISRAHIERDRKIYGIAIDKWNREKKRLHYDDLPDRLKTQKNRTSFTDRFKVVAADLPHSHTMVAHISKDGHYYIHPDINQLRSLTVREAARIQSFPDNFYFEGPRTAMFKQIGNAVPVLMAETIAGKIKEMLN